MDISLVMAAQGLPGISPLECAVLVALASCRDHRTGLCAPSVSTVAEMSHYCRRSVLGALEALKRKGVIEVYKMRGSRGDRNGYKFKIEAREVEVVKMGAEDAPQGVQLMHPLDGELCTKGAGDSPVRVQDLHPLDGELCTKGAVDAPVTVQMSAENGATVAPVKIYKDNFLKRVCDTGAHTGARGSVPIAKNGLGGFDPVPASYAAWRFAELENTGWTLPDGRKVAPEGFAAHVRAWWRNERDRERWLKVERREDRPLKVTAADWALCLERCGHCREGGGCACGVTIPPAMDRERPHPPEECPTFAARMETREGAA